MKAMMWARGRAVAPMLGAIVVVCGVTSPVVRAASGGSPARGKGATPPPGTGTGSTVTLDLKITNAADKSPVAGAHLEYFDLFARKAAQRWTAVGGASGKPVLSKSTLSGSSGRQANYTVRTHIPDFSMADRKRRYKRVVLRVVKKGFESAHFFINLKELFEKRTYHSEISLRPLGLVSHWRFDEGKGEVAAESTGQGNPGKITGAEWVTSGKRTALRFDGIDDVVDCGTNPVYEQQDAITVLLWIKPAKAITRMESLIGRAWRNPYALYTRKGNGLEVSFFLGNHKGQSHRGNIGGAHYATKPAILNVGEWNLVGFSYGASTGRIKALHNGKVVGQRSVRSKEGRFMCVPSNQPLSIGCFDGMTHFKGLIDDVRMYNYELSEQEVGKVYGEGAGK